MKYINRNSGNTLTFKLNTTPINPYSGSYIFNCKHLQTNTNIVLNLDDISTQPNTYQKFFIDSGDSENFQVGQYEVSIYDYSASTILITTEYFTILQSVDAGNVYFMNSDDTAIVYNFTGDTAVAPSPPINFSAVLDSDGVSVTLTYGAGSSNTQFFELWRKLNVETYILVDGNIQSFIYHDYNLAEASTYTYKLRAGNDSGYSVFTPEISILTSTGSTGTSFVTLIGGGGTFISNPSLNTWIVRSVEPTGTTVQWGNINGSIANQVDLTQVLSSKTDAVNFTGHTGNTQIHTAYSAITEAIAAATSGLTSSWSGLTGMPQDNQDLVNLIGEHTGDTSIHFIMSDITGFTSTQAFTNHTGDTDIHYVMSGISIAESQVQGLVGKYSLSGHTHPQYLTGITSSQITGVTDSLYVNISSYNYDMNVLSGILDEKSDTGHTHPQYLTGYTVTAGDITGVTDSLYVGINTYNYDMNVLSGVLDGKSDTGHTHSIYASKTAFNTYTGTTAVQTYKKLFQSRRTVSADYVAVAADNDMILIWADSANHTITLPSTGLTIGTHYLFFKQAGTGSLTVQAGAGATIFGNCPVIESGDYLEVYYQSMGIWYVIRKNKPDWGKIQSKPSWLSGGTLTAFQNAHTHSQYLTGVTVNCSDITGCTSSLYAAIEHTHGQYLTGYTVTAGDITGITSTLYAAIEHTHPISGVTLLQQALDGKSGTEHTHNYNSTFVNVTGDTMTGTLSIPNGSGVNLNNTTGAINYFYINGQTGSTRGIFFRTNNNYRWGIFTDSTSEALGYGYGSNLRITAYSGVSTTIHTPLVINRQTGIINLQYTPTINNVSLNNIYSQTGHTHSYNDLTDLPSLFTGYTFTASGACEIAVAGNQVTIYAPSGGTSGGTSAEILQKTGTTYTIQASDDGQILEFTNTGATTITLPTGLTTNFQVTLVSYGDGTSSGVKTIAAGTGATLKTKYGATKMTAIFAAATLYYRGNNVWVGFGDLNV